MLKEGWVFPKIPKGYDTASVIIGVSGNVTFDYTAKRKKFLGFVVRQTKIYSIHSKLKKENIEWPWVKGYEPTKSDWADLGFFVGHSFDNCFGGLPERMRFSEWDGKGD